MPVGYVAAVVFCATGAALALWPRPTRGPRVTPAYVIETAANEVPVAILYLLAASTLLTLSQGQLISPLRLVGLALAGLTTAGLVVVARRSLLARPTLERALALGLGEQWRDDLAPDIAAELRPPIPVDRHLFWSVLVTSRDVRRVRDLAYGTEGRGNLLDLYHHRSPRTGCPVLVYFHGGGFFSGGKSREARLIFQRLVHQGWVCVSANYRLAARGVFPNSLGDAEQAIAWVRRHAPEYGGDPDTLFAAGGSAGAHLAATCALSGAPPVAGAILLYGYYGEAPTDGGSTGIAPGDRVHAGAPPFLVVHGGADPMVPASAARDFADELRSVSVAPVVYAELPAAQHAFDRYGSVRCAAVAEAIEGFAAWVRSS
jgi:acetyl esterase/lipase